MNTTTRKWLYGLGAPATALLVSYGVISDSDASLWVGLLGAVLAVGELSMAAAYTEKREPVKVVDESERWSD